MSILSAHEQATLDEAFRRLIRLAGYPDFLPNSANLGSMIDSSPSLEGWTDATLINSWIAYGALGATPGYRKNPEGRVSLRGWLKGGSSGTAVFTLPTEYRPTSTLQFPITADAAHLGVVQINPNGNVQVFDQSGGSSVNTLATLDSINFFVDQ